MTTDTIVAIATPPGRGGVGIVRISGPKAYSIALNLNGNIPLKPRLAHFCSLYKSTNELIDQGLMIYFKAPNSFTGEEVVEIHAHGSPIVLDILIRESTKLGARIARPGEYSERAFLNDKIDLTQAEAIADLIQASSETAAAMALRSLKGEFSQKINDLNADIIYLRMFVEAAIDFPEEEIDFLNDGKVSNLLLSIMSKLEHILSQANQGVLMREGMSIVIAGRPNAGKSTLINRLAGREVAIVTDIAGTTRDVMREHILLDEIPLHIIDTAGLRDSHDFVEKEGIKRAWKEIKTADCILLLFDANYPEHQIELLQEFKQHLDKNIPIISVANKIDLTHSSPKQEKQTVYISAKTGSGITELKSLLKKTVGFQPAEGHFIARRRHLEALNLAMKFLKAGENQLTSQKAGELLAEDLRLAHQSLCEITGEFTSDDLLGSIFSSFCIGK
ncbi:tRNA uridine-5-carboxymethylaminomethyl(34) synthesis GTPase MnmE [Legionella waltersii]|uniref:tRNA modification GTPase MnmE n=1 Tax=Legionella waltersii TaxID=66969 RepID=A0A0W1A575_9GAMM|nr:tRNA uridine-5-carboxymethylaminomethyl(34) synthesis GTPase MnmE [Legionella waltersii]KTD76485.1 tRNA modification GTPase TrmE [Legionella waltersii]SNV14723.1 GTP binding protein in thiophene and furan oxidation (GTPase) [Legionella waltersii]